MKTPSNPVRLPIPLLAAGVLSLGSLPLTLEAAPRDLDRDGRPNISDSDIDNDGLPNGRDRNVDGGVARSGPLRGRYIGDRLNNDNKAESDIDGDGLSDDSSAEKDIDGDGRSDDSPSETDIDGDGRSDDSPSESDIDGDGKADDSADENDIDGDGIKDEFDDDGDGDGRDDDDDNDDDGDGRGDADDSDDDGDGVDDEDEVSVIAPGVVGDGSAPVALTGLRYKFAEGDDQETEILSFTSATGGVKTEVADVDGFTYTYSPNSTTAVVTVQYGVGKYDEFTFDFATGSFIRKRYRENLLERTKTGNFALVVAS
ncbi:MAG: hypothetical protein DVB23_003355 [Verrucomicrobia bacterium]|nr:MAG: hypothetical protein DVB23_003355 [Verrucomicrobiota bacterium]